MPVAMLARHEAPAWELWLTGGYLAVTGAMLLRLMIGLVLSRGLLRAARPVREGWATGGRVRASGAIDAPVTVGRTIVLPADCNAWAAATQQAVLAHERAHIAHGDFCVLLLSQVNRAVFWFSPLSWWLHRRLAGLAELASDDAAIEALGDRPGYAAILLEMAGRSGQLFKGVAMARPATMNRRIERILTERQTSLHVGRFRRAACAFGVVPLAIVAAVSIAGAAPSDTAAPAEQREPHTPVSIDPKLLDAYAGFYRNADTGSVMVVTRDGDHLLTRRAGNNPVPEYPYTDHDFFLTIAPQQNSFVTDASGLPVRVVHHQMGHDEILERISAEAGQQAVAALDQRMADERAPHVEARIDPNLLDGYVGTYQLAPQLIFTVTREGDTLSAQLTGQPVYQVHPYTDHDFFYTVVAAQLSFLPGADGKATAVILHQNGRDRTAPRVDPALAQTLDRKRAEELEPHTAVSINPRLLDGYVGRYRSADLEITVTRDRDQLFVRVTGYRGYAVYPYADHDFFATIVPAQISFITDGTGKATELIRHQFGVDALLNRTD